MLAGDWLAKTMKDLGVPACMQCQVRQEKLNQLHLKVREFLSSGPPGSSGSSSSSTSE